MNAVDEVRVGGQLPPLTVEPISRTTLALFAGASGDHNPIHIDVDVARSAGLDDVFAHGMLSMAYLARLVTNWVPQHRIHSLRTRFVAITPVGAKPTCTGKVVAVDEGSGHSNGNDERTATIELTVALEDGTVTLAGEAVVALAAAA